MSTTRTGKIARLPLEIRTQLNERLRNGERARKLIAWLNALPEVQAVLAHDFAGQPISECNFTAWRQGGFHQWLQEQQAHRLARDLGENVLAGSLDPEGAPPLSKSLAWWVTASYCIHREKISDPEGDVHWKLLHQMCRDVVALRRSDHRDQRLELERERQEFTRNTKRPEGRSNPETPPSAAHAGTPHEPENFR